MITVDISYESDSMESRAPFEQVQSVIANTCTILGERSCELSCSFVSDERMEKLNFTYRGKQESTDILSFVQSDSEEPFPLTLDGIEGERLLGDLVISLDAMERNCETFSVSAEEELTRLLVHGVLHLLGWDHETNDADEPMLQKQEELVKMVMKESNA